MVRSKALDLDITRDPRTGLLVASIPGELEMPKFDAVELDVDVDVAALREQVAPVIAEFRTRGRASARCFAERG